MIVAMRLWLGIGMGILTEEGRQGVSRSRVIIREHELEPSRDKWIESGSSSLQ